MRRGLGRGLRFSAAVTVGNCADLGPYVLLEYYLADPQTRVVGIYLEAVKDGRRLFDLLKANRAEKPVVLTVDPSGAIKINQNEVSRAELVDKLTRIFAARTERGALSTTVAR